jgi:hypothetical protein
MRAKRMLRVVLSLVIVEVLATMALSPSTLLLAGPLAPQADDPNPPTSPVKLVFIHHSCGNNWLNTGNGNLGDQLGANNYYVSDTYYGWGPDSIGSDTDIGHWWTWFRGPDSPTYTQAVYDTTNKHATYTRPMADPGGQNEIIMFKSCYPNSNLSGDPAEIPPPIGSNPLRGQGVGSNHTVANAKGIYIDLLEYFATQPEKLFVVIAAPPLQDGTWASNARAFNTWLVEDWLDGYGQNNVAVFDFYNVLTDPDNHHHFHDGAVEYVTDQGSDTLYYPSGDDHPNSEGNQKATAEFVPLLNVYYNRWKSDSSSPSLALDSPSEGELWTVGRKYQIQWTTTGTVNQVNLSYSEDGFGSSTDIATAIANTGSYEWTTPAITSTSMQVRVESVISPTTVYDVSDEFTLRIPFVEIHLPVALSQMELSP